MAKFEEIKTSVIKYGDNNFIEVALKRVTGEEETAEAQQIISLSKGWFPKNAEGDNTRRFKTSFGFPAEKEIIEQIVAALNEYTGMI